MEGENAKKLVEGDRKWTKFNEKEVILLPMFCFQVIDIREHPTLVVPSTGKPIKIVEVQEIPFQHALEIRQVFQTRVI